MPVMADQFFHTQASFLSRALAFSPLSKPGWRADMVVYR